MNRGSLAMDNKKLGESLGFNEAPIHESGKSGRSLAISVEGVRLQ